MIQDILAAWGLDHPRIEVIGRGIRSGACLITTDDARCIFRKLSGARQGRLEFRVAALLSPLEIAPRVIPTRSGEPFAEYDGAYYNLQAYVGDRQLDASDEPALRQAAKQTALMHKALEALPKDMETDDRYSLASMTARCNWPYLTAAFAEAGGVERFREFCISLIPLDAAAPQWIHGDLGTWNMRYDGSHVTVIDFGECRTGSVYFDAAAAITSLLSPVRDQNTIDGSITLFLEEYAKYHVRLRRDLLSDYIALWFVRGILANALEENYRRGPSEQAVDHFIKQMKKFGMSDRFPAKTWARCK